MMRQLMFCLVAAVGFAVSSPAMAQQRVLGPYCGDVTWQGQPPTNVWIYLRPNNTWTAAVEGALSEVDTGAFTQSGATVVLTGGSPQYRVTATIAGERLLGEVSAADGRRGTISVTLMHGTGAGLRSSTVPPNFASDAAEQALAGSMQGVLEATSWGWTPQGVEYWRAIYQSGQLPDHAAAALRDWIRRAQAGERPVCDAQ